MNSTYDEDIAELTELRKRYSENQKAYDRISALIHYIKQLKNDEKDTQ